MCSLEGKCKVSSTLTKTTKSISSSSSDNARCFSLALLARSRFNTASLSCMHRNTLVNRTWIRTIYQLRHARGYRFFWWALHTDSFNATVFHIRDSSPRAPLAPPRLLSRTDQHTPARARYLTTVADIRHAHSLYSSHSERLHSSFKPKMVYFKATADLVDDASTPALGRISSWHIGTCLCGAHTVCARRRSSPRQQCLS